MSVDPVQPVPELVKGGGVQGEVRDIEWLPAGQHNVPHRLKWTRFLDNWLSEVPAY